MQQPLQYSGAGRRVTEGFEQCRFLAYIPRPGDKWTLGWGHTRGVHEGMVCTQEQADQWEIEDTQVCVDWINAHVAIQLTQHEFDALVDFAFNLGCENLHQSTLLKKLNAGDHAGAAEEFEKWQYAGGVKMAGLLRRRLAEKAEFLTPEVQPEEGAHEG